MANYLLLLSGGPRLRLGLDSEAQVVTGRVFECKTCNRQFPSFQALGGHRASHKKARSSTSSGPGSGSGPGPDDDHHDQTDKNSSRMHECSICGLEFAIGQALGGHMRRHRAELITGSHPHHSLNLNSPSLSLSLSSSFSATKPASRKTTLAMKRSKNTRVLSLDLNLTPLENRLLSEIKKVAPIFA